MKNFLRAMRFAWPYRYRIGFSILCALLAAAFWSLTFTAIDPVLRILRHEQSLQEIINGEIRRIQTDQIDPLQKKLNDLNEGRQNIEKLEPGLLKDKLLRQISRDLDTLQTRLQGAQRQQSFMHVALKYVEMLLPDDRFETVDIILALVVVSVAIQGFFEFWQESLVGSVVIRSQYLLRNRFFRRAIFLDVSNFTESGTHELMARFTNDMDTLSTGMKT